jgi:hypothetical protein
MVNSIERLFWVTGARTCSNELGYRPRRRWIAALRVSFAFVVSCVLLPGLAPAQTSPTASVKAAPPSAVAAAPASVIPSAASPAASPSTAPVAAPPPSPLNPAPSEFPESEPAASAPALDALLSRVAALRSRIAALTSALFSSKLRVELRSAGEDVRLKSLTVSLDGGVVYRAPAQSFFERPELVYEHAVAPGPHVIGVEVERHDSTRPEFSTWQASRFVVVGEYDLRIRLQAEVGD